MIMTKKLDLEIVASKLDVDTLVGLERELYDKAVSFNAIYTKLKSDYRDIFCLVRDNHLQPERVDLILAAAGFNRQRASEMRRICATDETTAKAYVSGAIGFKVVLAVERAKGKRGKPRKVAVVVPFHVLLAKLVTRQACKPFFTVSGGFGLVCFPVQKPTGVLKSASGHSIEIEKFAVKLAK